MPLARCAASAPSPGCKSTSALPRGIPAARSPTLTAASSASTPWSPAASRSLCPATRSPIFSLPTPSTPGSAGLSRPCAGSRPKTFGLVLLEVEPDSPAANASLLPGDILLGTDVKSFASLDDLASSLQGSGPRLLRLAFLRGDYERFRRVSVQLGAQRTGSAVAA